MVSGSWGRHTTITSVITMRRNAVIDMGFSKNLKVSKVSRR